MGAAGEYTAAQRAVILRGAEGLIVRDEIRRVPQR